MFYNYKELKLKLLKFSKYKILDKNATKIECQNKIQTLQKYKETHHGKQTHVVVLLISDDKIVKTINKKLDKFDLDFFNPYNKERENLKVVVYKFDVKDKDKYNEFMGECYFFKFTSLSKKYYLYITSMFSILMLFFSYFAFTEYGIPDSYITDITSISFLMLSTLSIFLIIVFLVMFIPLLIIYILTKQDINLLNLKHSFLFSILFTTIVGLFFVYQNIISSILSTVFKNDNLFNKSGYEFIMSEYFYHYSGYPKILKKDNKYYYLPVKDNRYYQVYNIEDVKKRYFKDLKNNKNHTKLSEICKNKDSMQEFKKYYIVNNPYIKPPYLTKQFSINDKNITIEDFKKNKLVSDDDIKDFCKDKD